MEILDKTFYPILNVKHEPELEIFDLCSSDEEAAYPVNIPSQEDDQTESNKIQEEKPESCESQKIFTRDLCDMEFLDIMSKVTHLDEHLKSDRQKFNVTPTITNRLLRVEEKDVSTVKTTDASSTGYPCSVCQKVFTAKSNRRTHFKYSHMKIKKFCCDLCGLEVIRKWNFKKHLDLHRGARGFACLPCGKQFTLRNHLKIHQRTKEHQKLLSNNSSNSDSIASSTTVKILAPIKAASSTGYPCSVCQNVFTTKSNRRKHFRYAHMNIKKFCCDLCGFEASRKWNFKNHLDVHRGVKPFACLPCGKHFTLRGNLIKHQRAKEHQKLLSISSK